MRWPTPFHANGSILELVSRKCLSSSDFPALEGKDGFRNYSLSPQVVEERGGFTPGEDGEHQVKDSIIR